MSEMEVEQATTDDQMGKRNRGWEFSADTGHLYDVVAVSIEDSTILWVMENKTLPNAEAIIATAVMRQGVEDRFFSEVPHGAYRVGEKWQGCCSS